MIKLLFIEGYKLKRSKVIWLGVFAVVLLAILVYVTGQSVYEGEEVHAGIKVLYHGIPQIESPGWYMDQSELFSTFFVIPGIIALIGTYMICREEEDDTMKLLRIIPINEIKLTMAKLFVTLLLSIGYYLLLFAITLGVECVLHFSELSIALCRVFLKEYILQGIGVFLAISPIVAIISNIKKGYWTALILTEIYSVGAMFASMSSVLKVYYPISAVFTLAGYDPLTVTGTEQGKSGISLFVCGGVAIIILFKKHRD